MRILLIDLHKVDKVNVVTVIKDVVLRMNLDLHNCRGQCYDGAASMAGSRTGAALKCFMWRSVPYLHTAMAMP